MKNHAWMFPCLVILLAVPTFGQAQTRVCIVRPENNGGINTLPVHVQVRQSGAPKQQVSLIGGGKHCFVVHEGSILVSAVSRKPYSDGRGDPAECKSNVLSLTGKEGNKITFSIEPRSKGPEYLCGWHLKRTEWH